MKAGGGKINYKSIFSFILLISLVLVINVSDVAAATNNTTTVSQGATPVSPQVIYTPSEVNAAAVKVKSFIDTNHRLPSYVTMNNYQVAMPQFLQLLSTDISQTSAGSATSIILLNVKPPSNSTETAQSGTLTQTEYVGLAKTVKSNIDTTGTAPGYANSSLGKIGYENLIYLMSKVMNFYATNNRLPSTLTVNPWNPTQTATGFMVGYYISPSLTPISAINFNALKSAGITDIYVLATNTNYATILSAAKTKASAVGIRTNAWVYPGFKYASQVAQMGIGVLLDVETYNMQAYVPQIQAMRTATKGVQFSIVTKPDGWDGNQRYDLIAPLCNYIIPMLYLGDYGQGITGLTNWVKTYNTKYPGKFIAGLETYVSDRNPTPKSASTISAEIRAVQPYTHGVALFRYGLSNFNGLPI